MTEVRAVAIKSTSTLSSADTAGQADPRVSVIMIFWNAELFMVEAIESVRAQTYRDWELLLIDDGSTDGSTEIARRYSANEPERIRYLSHPGGAHRGSAATRNLGLNSSRGKYVAFLDADDVYLPNKLEEQVALLDRMPDVAMLYGRTRLWYTWEKDHARGDKLTDAAPRRDCRYEPPDLVTAFLEDEIYYPCTCSTLIRRSAIETVGGCDESFPGTYEDMTLFMKLCLKYSVYVASDCWDYYRRHPDSTWARAFAEGKYQHGKLNPVRRAFLEWVEELARAHPNSDQLLQRTVARQLFPYRHPWRAMPGQLLGRAMAFSQKRIRRPLMALPARLGQRLHRLQRRKYKLPLRFGSFRRLEPISPSWGFDRGQAVDRYFIERFLQRHAEDVHGRVLEVGDDGYTRRFGGDRVAKVDILHIDDKNPRATIVDDLAKGTKLPSDAFDCMVLTQTLQYIPDVRSAISTLNRALKPGGVLLLTVPGLSARHGDESGAEWYWAFTARGAVDLVSSVFGRENVTARSHGNVLLACAFLQGIAAEELREEELAYYDPSYDIVTLVRAVKPASDA